MDNDSDSYFVRGISFMEKSSNRFYYGSERNIIAVCEGHQL